MSVMSGIVFGVREVRANVTVKQGLRGCGSQVCGQGIQAGNDGCIGRFSGKE